jgi:hypothetical protein
MISISDGTKPDKTIHVNHPTVPSKVWNFMKSFPPCVSIGGGFGASLLLFSFLTKTPRAISSTISEASRAFFGNADVYSVSLTGAIIGAALTVALVLVREIRSVTSPSSNRALYDFVREGDERALSALKSHLIEEGVFRAITESEKRFTHR